MYIKLCIGNIVLRMSAPVPSPAVLDTMVNIIMSQTEMSRDIVVSELERTNYDLKRVIREYMRGDSASASASTSASGTSSANQLRFSEIRNFMDKSSEMYYRKQETTRIYNEVLERKKQMAAAAAEAAAATEAEAASAASAVKAKL